MAKVGFNSSLVYSCLLLGRAFSYTQVILKASLFAHIIVFT